MKFIDRFRAWQKNPIRYTDKGMEGQHCANCGNDYTGNYCPVCGQKADGSQVTWRWLAKSIMNLWGMDSRSLPYTVWQLLFRPGYLIGDYLAGRRQVCYPPVNMLFIVAIVYTLAKYLIGVEPAVIEIEEDDTLQYLYKAIDWLQKNPGWGMMLLTMFMILPTWFYFRFAPRNARHTIPEGFFIQLFMASLMLIISLVISVTSYWMYVLIPLYYYFCYRQLFGYRAWGTIWRLVLSFFVWMNLCLIIICEAIVISSLLENGLVITEIVIGSLIFIAILLIIAAAILALGHFLGKKQYGKKNGKHLNILTKQ